MKQKRNIVQEEDVPNDVGAKLANEEEVREDSPDLFLCWAQWLGRKSINQNRNIMLAYLEVHDLFPLDVNIG